MKRQFKFQPGDVVRLRIGGPQMTVRRINIESGLVECDWFEDTTLWRSRFNAAELERIAAALAEGGEG